MTDNLTNLLPVSRRHALSREYHIRLGVIAVLFGTALIAIAGVLLLPTYVFLVGSVNAKESHLADIQSILSSSDGSALSARLAALSKETEALSSLSDVRTASSVVGLALVIPRPGVTISGFTYTPASGGKKGTLTLSGTAASRAALRSYQLALQDAAFAQSAELPVSAYAKDIDITFAITVILAS